METQNITIVQNLNRSKQPEMFFKNITNFYKWLWKSHEISYEYRTSTGKMSKLDVFEFENQVRPTPLHRCYSESRICFKGSGHYW